MSYHYRENKDMTHHNISQLPILSKPIDIYEFNDSDCDNGPSPLVDFRSPNNNNTTTKNTVTIKIIRSKTTKRTSRGRPKMTYTAVPSVPTVPTIAENVKKRVTRKPTKNTDLIPTTPVRRKRKVEVTPSIVPPTSNNVESILTKVRGKRKVEVTPAIVPPTSKNIESIPARARRRRKKNFKLTAITFEMALNRALSAVQDQTRKDENTPEVLDNSEAKSTFKVEYDEKYKEQDTLDIDDELPPAIYEFAMNKADSMLKNVAELSQSVVKNENAMKDKAQQIVNDEDTEEDECQQIVNDENTIEDEVVPAIYEFAISKADSMPKNVAEFRQSVDKNENTMEDEGQQIVNDEDTMDDEDYPTLSPAVVEMAITMADSLVEGDEGWNGDDSLETDDEIPLLFPEVESQSILTNLKAEGQPIVAENETSEDESMLILDESSNESIDEKSVKNLIIKEENVLVTNEDKICKEENVIESINEGILEIDEDQIEKNMENETSQDESMQILDEPSNESIDEKSVKNSIIKEENDLVINEQEMCKEENVIESINESMLEIDEDHIEKNMENETVQEESILEVDENEPSKDENLLQVNNDDEATTHEESMLDIGENVTTTYEESMLENDEKEESIMKADGDEDRSDMESESESSMDESSIKAMFQELRPPKNLTSAQRRALKEGKPFPLRSSFNYFVHLCYEEYTRICPIKERVKFPEFLVICSDRWKSLNEKEKWTFNDMAKRDKERYEEEHKTYQTKGEVLSTLLVAPKKRERNSRRVKPLR